jgi:hypothetical protein
MQHCGGAIAIAGAKQLRISGAVILFNNKAGSGGAVCALSDSQLTASILRDGMILTQYSSHSADTCHQRNESLEETLATASPFMINTLLGARLTVSVLLFCCD